MRRNSVFLGIMRTRPSVGAGMHPDPVHLSDGVRADTGRGEREGPSGPDLKGLRQGVVDPTMRRACGHHHPKTMICLSGSFGCPLGGVVVEYVIA